MKRLGPLAKIAAIVVLAGVLRFHGMADLHLMLWDDAVVTLEARGLAAGASEARRSLERKQEENRSGRDLWKRDAEMGAIRRAVDEAGIPLRFGRPLHEALLALVLAAWRDDAGEWPDWAASWLSACAGTLSVYLLYLLGTVLYGRRTGLLSALFLAISGYHVMYSREGFTEAILVAFQILALLLYVRARRMPVERPYSGLVPLGLVCGVGMTAHLRFVLIPGILGLYEALHWLRFRRHGAGVEARRLALFGSATCLAPLACEVPYYFLYLGTNRLGLGLHVMTYVEQLLLVLRSTGLGYAGSLVRFHVENLLTYPYALVQYEGFAKTALVAAGVVVAARRRKLGDGLVLAFLAGVPLYYSATVPLLRYGSLAIPLASLLAARVPEGDEDGDSGDRPPATRRLWREVAHLAALLVFIEGSARALTVVETESGYREAVGSIPTPHVSTMLPVSQAYAGPARARPVPNSIEGLRQLATEGYRALLVDNLANYLSFEGKGFPAQAGVIRDVERSCAPARKIRNPFGGSLQFALELNYRPFFETLALMRSSRKLRSDEIAIYDLDECPRTATLSRSESRWYGAGGPAGSGHGG